MDHPLITQQSLRFVGVRLANGWMGWSVPADPHRETIRSMAVMEQAGIPFTVRTADVEEVYPPDTPVMEVAAVTGIAPGP